MSSISKYDHKEMTSGPCFTSEQIDVIKTTFCKGLSDDEFKVFLYTCQRTSLDPYSRQIYAIKRGNAMTIQTGIDGYRVIADRTGCYAPGKEATFSHDDTGRLISATAYVKKRTPDGTWHEVSCTAYYEEYVQVYNGKPSGLWQKMPRTMLAKCAESLALRKCWPSDLSGIYTKEEMDQADVIEVPAVSKAIEYISDDELREITSLIAECDPEKQKTICDFVHSKCGGDFEKLTKDWYLKILPNVIERRNEYKAKTMQADGEEKDE